MPSPKLIIFTAPSGAGKTTIVKHLLKVRNDLAFSISACTRAQRYGEVNGMDYYFLTPAEFKRRVNNNEFVEWEEVYENQYYGTLKSEIDRLLNLGKNVVFDIDVKGAVNIQKHYPGISLSVFVKPPSTEELINRLVGRNTEDQESLRKRISRAKEELTFEKKFDYALVNKDLDVALKEAELIVDTFINDGQEGLKNIKHGDSHNQ
jgi:guanylate kinase